MQVSWLNKIQSFFTPAHKKPVDEHIIRDRTTQSLIDDTEQLLIRMAKNAPSYNKRQTIRRKQKEWLIKVKITYSYITVIMMDLKTSTSPIKKRFHIICHRRYMRSKDGVGECKEASIRFIKDGRAHIRSIKESPLFHNLFYHIHHLDLVYSNESMNSVETSLDLFSTQYNRLQSNTNDFSLLLEEANRYVKSLKQFTTDPAIDNRLNKIIQRASALQEDFAFLDFEERHIIKRMLKEDIPSLMHTYLSLSMMNQLEQKENIYVTLTKMELTLIHYTEHLEKLKVERMDYLLKLQALRYDK
ncbi:hypothetical protein GN156_10510 [bacterium LRH843]|nr:hypothetical protein [bacterium LRH843]